MRIDIKGKFFNHKDVWFEDIDCINSISNCDYAIVHAVAFPKTLINNRFIIINKQNSLITDLSGSIENLKINKTFNYHIKRAKKEDVVIEFFNSSEIMKNYILLQEFASMYEEMYREKGVSSKLNLSMLKQYAEQNKLMISTASINKSRTVFHAYVFYGNNSRLLFSCSNFRIQDKETCKAIGRANKYLHWCDMEYLKSIGVTVYDWGGIHSFKEPNGIDQFKLAFGGKPITYYNLIVPISFRYKLICLIKKIFFKFKRHQK